MNVSIGKRWEEFVNELVKNGRYGSASEVVRQGLRQVEAQEAQLRTLREEIQAAIDEDVWYTTDEVVAYINEHLDDEYPEADSKQ